MTTGRINQVASLTRRRSRRTRIPRSGRGRREAGRWSRGYGGTSLACATFGRNGVVALVCGSALTTSSPGVSAGAFAFVGIELRFYVGLTGRRPIRSDDGSASRGDGTGPSRWRTR